MALETLIGIKKILGERVMVMDDLKEDFPQIFNESGQMDYVAFEKHIRPVYPIQIRHDKNSISFTIQNGPVKEFGKNGCQVDHIIAAAKVIIEGLNKKFPDDSNESAIACLENALYHLDYRRRKRVERGVEGYSKE